MKPGRFSLSLIILALSSVPVITRAECPSGRDTCLQGYVWREAFPDDHVCVTGATRAQATYDNSQADARREPGGGPFGPDTCRQGYVWREARPDDHVCVTGATRAQAAYDNSQADARRDPSCTTLSLHAEFVRVGVFNMNNPGLSELNWDQRIETLQRWGRQLFSKADVVMLSELGTPSSWPWDWQNDVYLKTLAEASGLVYRYAAFGPLTWDPTWPDIGIISRYPFDSEPVIHGIPGSKKILDVTITIHGRLHRFLSTHFTQEGDTPYPQAARIESVLKVRELIAGESKGVIFGGDLNTCPPVPSGQESGPLKGECNGGTAEGVEYKMVADHLTDSFRAVPGSVHCSDARIDYLFFRGPYTVVKYESYCGTDKEPSDHPYVLVTLEFIGYPPPPPPPPPRCSSTEKCCGSSNPDGTCDGQCWPKNKPCP